MGWDHITTYTSQVNTVISIMDDNKLPYQVIDIYPNPKLRMLITATDVYLEAHINDTDCDGHSDTCSKKFSRAELATKPIKWLVYYEPQHKVKKYIKTKDYDKFIIPEDLKVVVPEIKHNNVDEDLSKKTKTIKKMCKFFLEGKCHDENCKFLHKKLNTPCKFFSGNCTQGNRCAFRHQNDKD